MLPRCALLLACAAAGTRCAPIVVNVSVSWDEVKVRTRTAATIEVDVMPFLGRTEYGGPFDAYFEALRGLEAEYVRYAPWYPNPRVSVPELTPSDCTADKPATNWNSTLLDGVIRDGMAAVCGPGAERGGCRHQFVPLISTMPSWMYVGGEPVSKLPENPWATQNPFSQYAGGRELVDKTCMQMARHMARLVGWYTAGGFHDECGHWHKSGLNYTWWGIAVLNEDEHHIQPDDGTAYNLCYDAIVKAIAAVNPTIIPVGPEQADPLIRAFLDKSKHADGKFPPVGSYHSGLNANNGSAESFFTQWDNNMKSFVMPLEDYKRSIGSSTELVLDEYIPFIGDWCDCKGIEHLCGGERFGKCPDWQDPATAGGDPNLQHAKGVGMNKETWSWNAAGAVFAYGYGTLAELQYKYVAQDQLVGGPWPDNEPAVTCLDWQTGQANAKYWVTQLLALTVGDSAEKAIVASNLTANVPPIPVGTTGDGTCGVTKYTDDCDRQASGAWNTTTHSIKSLADCAAKARGCKMGNYISFSLHNEDCSWYQSCEMGSLMHVGAHYTTEVLRVTPASATASQYVYVMPYTKGGGKGILVVNKKASAIEVRFAGVTGGSANVVEVQPGPEPAMNPPIARHITDGGVLSLGPFGVAVITQFTE